jgi:hypothetical protein
MGYLNETETQKIIVKMLNVIRDAYQDERYSEHRTELYIADGTLILLYHGVDTAGILDWIITTYKKLTEE